MRFVAFIALLFVIAACAPAQGPRAPDQVAQQPVIAPPTPSDEHVAQPTDAKPNAEVQALSAKAGQIKSYTFDLARLPSFTADVKYFVRGSKAKIKLVTPLRFDTWNADYIYLDYDARTATAYCIDLDFCKKLNRTESVSFEQYGIKLPQQWLDEIQYGVKKTSLQYNNRQVNVVAWQEGAVDYEAYLDSFYGYPQRVAMISGQGEDAKVIGGYEYQSMSFNTVKEEDVTAPY